MNDKIVLLIIHLFIIILLIRLLYRRDNLINLRADHKEEAGTCCKCKDKNTCIHKPMYLTFDCDENIAIAKDTLKSFYKLMYTNEEYNKIREKIDGETVEAIEKRFLKMIRFRELEQIRMKEENLKKLQNDEDMVNRVLENMEAVGLDKFLSTISMASDVKERIRIINTIKNKNIRERMLARLDNDIESIIDMGSVIPESEAQKYKSAQTNYQNPELPSVYEKDYN